MEKTATRHRSDLAQDAPSYERNAPPMGQDFAKAHGQSPNDSGKKRYLARRARETGNHAPEQDNQRISTRAELDQRRSERAKPAPALELNMAGGIRRTVDHQTQAQNEKQIYLLERRLESVRNEPTRQFNRNR